MLVFKDFARKFIARPSTQLQNSPLVDVDSFRMPYGTAIHYVSDSPNYYGIRGSNPLIINWLKSIGVFHVRDHLTDRGRPRKVRVSDTVIRNYFKSQKEKVSKVPNLQRAIPRERQLLVLDYTMIKSSLGYLENKFMFYNEYYNIATTMIGQASDIGDARHHFIHIKMPEVVPSLQDFKKQKDETPEAAHLDTWLEYSQFWLRELWLLISGKGLLLSIAKTPGSFACLEIMGKVVTLDLNRLYVDGQEKELLTHAYFYKLVDRLNELTTAVDSEALSKVKDEDLVSETVVEDIVVQQTKELVAAGSMTSKEQERFITIAHKGRNIILDNGSTLAEFSVTKPEDYILDDDLRAPIDERIITKEEAKSTISNFHKSYVNKVMDKHISAVALSFTPAGYILSDFSVTQKVDAINNNRLLKMTILPVHGKQTTFEFPIPNIADDGKFMADGITYSMDTQRIDAPIRKTGVGSSALTSYYGKLFVSRSSKAVDSWSRWVNNKVSAMALNTTDTRIINSQRGTNLLPKIRLPRMYSALLPTITRFRSKQIDFYFDYNNRLSVLGEKAKLGEKAGKVCCGKLGDQYVYMDMSNNLYKGNELIGDLITYIGGPWGKEPTDMAVVKMAGKHIPVGLILGSYLGVDGLIKLTKAKTRRVPSNTQSPLKPNEMVLTFKDEKIFIDKSNPIASMLFAGYASIKDQLKIYRVSDLNRKEMYTPLMLDMGISQYAAKEMETMKELFIDPMTKDALIAMKEPTEFIPLLVRAVELIVTDEHPDETDPMFQRLRGYERIPGFIYAAILRAIKQHKNVPGRGSARLDISNFQIWQDMTGDSSTQLVQESNPIHNLKEQEAITLSGAGGRSARTLVKRSRKYHNNDLGIISESTPDSAKVAIRTFATPNAKIKSTLGFMGEWDKENDNTTSLLSTTSLLLPASHHDDPKRANLASVQQSAMVPARGYTTMPYSTGYDRVIATRVGDNFALSAKLQGEVIKVSSKRIVVRYSDESKDGANLGIKHGSVAGEYVAHKMFTDLKKGDKFAKGDLIAWDEYFFERDIFNHNNLVMLTGVPAVIALAETNDTLEDGSAISEELGIKLTTTMTKRKTFLLRFDQSLSNVLNVGDEVEYATPLLTISNSDIEEEVSRAALAVLSKLSSASPKAGFSGTITKMDLIYMGNTDDMSSSLKDLAIAFDKHKASEKTELGGPRASTNQVSNSMFFGGERIEQDTLAISFYIDEEFASGVGDKTVFGNQLKTIHGRVMSGVNETESGIPLDALFGLRSVFARIVGSSFIAGTGNRLLRHGSLEFVRILRGG